MPSSYLEKLAQATLPLTVTDPGEIRKIEMLRAALLVTATLHPANTYAPPHTATVHAITPSGWDVLAKQPKPS
ncbi:hypothetical protein ACSFBX_34060 [Variovorax sp. RB2P76]|uniref:hypothetical protein n=1 Tax=Variovorax sp. RB2P76 TaxID=3443736 RepID=UPI003F48200B